MEKQNQTQKSIRGVAFLFPGQGSQFINMGLELYREDPVFHKIIDQCAELLMPILGSDVRGVLYPSNRLDQTEELQTIDQTAWTQPILFMVEYALAKVWIARGVTHAAMIGHSIGEYVAACLSGVFSLEDALLIVAERGRLMQSLPEGAMLSVSLTEEEVSRYLDDERLSLSAVNGPKLMVLGGPHEAIADLEKRLEDHEIEYRKIRTSHAFHSSMVEPVLTEFKVVVKRSIRQSPQFLWMSNLTGDFITSKEAIDPEYWVQQMRQPVRFAMGMKNLLQACDAHLLEVGPGESMLAMCSRLYELGDGRSRWATLPHPSRKKTGDLDHLSHVLAQMKNGEKAAATRYTPASETLLQEPRNETERVLLELWSKLFERDNIDIFENFFEIGGHSMLGLRLVNQVRRKFKVECTLSILVDHPTIVDLALNINEKLGLVAFGEIGTTVLSEAKLFPNLEANRSERYDPFPLMDLQQAYLLGRQSEFEYGNIGAHLYNEFDCVDLDLLRFSASFNRMVQRHEMLRAVMLPEGLQKILPDVPAYEIQVEDLRLLSATEQPERLQAIRDEIEHTVPQIDRWPLFEIRVTIMDDDLVRVHTKFEYLIVDALTYELINHEWSALYQDLEADLPLPKVSYRDYVMAVSSLLESEAFLTSRKYWSDRVPTMHPAPQLPVLSSKKKLSRLVGRRGKLDATSWARLKERAAKQGITPSGILCAILAEIVAMWSETRHFTLNLPTFNRMPLHPQVENIMGAFTSTTLLEVDFGQLESFAERASSLQKQMLRDLDHRSISGVTVLREISRYNQDPARAVMPVVFTSFVNHDMKSKQWTSLSWMGNEVYRGNQAPQILLDNQVSEEHDGTLVYYWDTLDEAFPEGLITQMFAAYEALVNRLSQEESPWQEVRPVPLDLPLQNNTYSEVPDQLLHEPFLAQVLQRKDQPAVIAANGTLSYQELQSRSAQVAHWLRKQGVHPNSLVAVVMEKGWEQVVAVLGILMSGAAYLPIDPKFPMERINHLLQVGEVECVVTQTQIDTLIKWPLHLKRLVVGQNLLPDLSTEPLKSIQHAEDLAYVIFTSGSTGLPKGVMINHRSVMNTLVDVNQRFGIGPEDRVLCLSSLHFDLSVWDIFGTLAAGGTILLPEAGLEQDPAHWVKWLVLERATIWNTVPALLEMLVDHLEARPALDLSLRLAMLSGDWIPLTLPDRARALVPSVQVISLGGATEGAIWSIGYPIGVINPVWRSIPYGQALTNQSIYVLDDTFTQRPVWVPGQLYIGGVGVADGYWRDEERTDASFLVHPLTGERLYRTGDLARLLPDGNFEFMGRADHQVKIRGYRIELEEIEATLRKLPEVRDAIVKASVDATGEKRLVAFVMPEASDNVNHELEQEQVMRWQEVFNTQYHQDQHIDLDWHLGGWNSSLTGQPISRAEMEEWVNNTVQRLLDLRPNRVLEIGCGTGLLLQRVAPYCEEYVGTDLSREAIVFLQDRTEALNLTGVRLLNLAADQLHDVPEGVYDLVVLNSVVQYFPNVDYLVEVLEKAILLCQPEGKIFVGDVRSKELNELFHTVVQQARAEKELTDKELQQRVHQTMNEESELVLETKFFHALQQVVPQLQHVEILPKQGQANNEMTNFRYDVILHLAPQQMEIQELQGAEWTSGQWDLDAVRSYLKEHGPDVLAFTGVPNARLDTSEQAVHPDTFVALSHEFPYEVHLSWAALQSDGRFDVVLKRVTSEQSTSRHFRLYGVPAGDLVQKLRAYANQPLFQVHLRQLHDMLQDRLRESLPEYMIPTQFVVLKEFPLTPNGKVDRIALREPVRDGLLSEHEGSKMLKGTEHDIALFFSELLGVTNIGSDTNFFYSGGDSLTATRLLSKIYSTFQVEISLRELFVAPTVANVAQLVEQAKTKMSSEDDMIQLMQLVQQMSPDEVEKWIKERKS